MGLGDREKNPQNSDFSDAAKAFIALRATSKQFAEEYFAIKFFDAMDNKFPDQRTNIANLLKNRGREFGHYWFREQNLKKYFVLKKHGINQNQIGCTFR